MSALISSPVASVLASSTTITAAALSGVGITATGALTVTIYQISHRIGRGKALTFDVPASP